jgi:hypothetical protein
LLPLTATATASATSTSKSIEHLGNIVSMPLYL